MPLQDLVTSDTFFVDQVEDDKKITHLRQLFSYKYMIYD
jgi:hypothetical protein